MDGSFREVPVCFLRASFLSLILLPGPYLFLLGSG